jgi:hypothetical protein
MHPANQSTNGTRKYAENLSRSAGKNQPDANFDTGKEFVSGLSHVLSND